MDSTRYTRRDALAMPIETKTVMTHATTTHQGRRALARATVADVRRISSSKRGRGHDTSPQAKSDRRPVQPQDTRVARRRERGPGRSGTARCWSEAVSAPR